MTSWWYCLECVAGSTENAASTLAQQHTERTDHATMGTTIRATWLTQMQKTATARNGGK